MALSFLFLKYAVVFAGIGSVAITPLMSSFGGASQTTSRGGQFGKVSSETRKVLTEKDIQDYGAIMSGETDWNGLSVNHAFYEHMKKTVSLDEFKKYYGVLDLKEENLSGGWETKNQKGPKGANGMDILDAWEKFFREDKKDDSDKRFSYFKEGSQELPFWNYDFPYIAVELPKGYTLPEGLLADTLDKGWVKVKEGLFPTGFGQYGTKWKGLTDSAYNFKKVIVSQGSQREEHKRKDTLNKIMRASPDADLYLVASPEKLLRMWLGEWKDSKVSENPTEDKYALFKNSYYSASEDHPEVSILTRWHKDKTYRMWIHHKTLEESVVKNNSSWKEIVAGKNRFSVGKDQKLVNPKLKWSHNFLLNLMIWYAYTYKWDAESASVRNTYQTVARDGAWNLREIYNLDQGANSKNSGYKDNFAKWIKDWYSGEKRNAQQYWTNVYNKFNLTNMTHFANRWERIQWVGKAMDELKDNWGLIKSASQLGVKS